MEQLTNPLRQKPLRALPAQDEVETKTPTPIVSQAALQEPLKDAQKTIVRVETVNMDPPKREVKTAPMIPHSIEVNNNPELKQAMELLAKHGIETTAPKKNYIKHSYEIEEDLHTEFHAMYPLLGFKHVKTAINDAIRMWCDENRKEFNRRKG